VNNTIRILICDDHTLFCEGIKAILRDQPSLEIVGEARDGRQAVELVKEHRPDVLLMDVSMPDMTGFDATRRIREFDSNVKVLILSMHDEEELVARCLEAGAAGYIIKDAPASQLLYAIETVYKGERYLSPVVLKKVVAGYVKNSQRPKTSYDRLSAREREVLKLLAEGLSVKEIATRLNLSVKTVDVHKYNLMRKIDVHDRAELIKYAIQKKLIAV
jgi:two-component system response regulator NreC